MQKMKRVKRINLDISLEERKKLESLCKNTGQSISDVVRHAISLYNFIGEKTITGSKFILRENNEDKEILILEFESK